MTQLVRSRGRPRLPAHVEANAAAPVTRDDGKEPDDGLPAHRNRRPARFTVPVVNRQGQEVGTVAIDPADFGGKISRN